MEDNMCENDDVFIGAPERIMYQNYCKDTARFSCHVFFTQ